MLLLEMHHSTMQVISA